MMKYDSKVYLTQMGQKKSVLIGVFVQDVCFLFLLFCHFFVLVSFFFCFYHFFVLVSC